MPMYIQLLELIGPACVSKEEGLRIYDYIYNPIMCEVPVHVEFAGVTQLGFPFINYSIGQLLRDKHKGDLTDLLLLSGLNEDMYYMINQVMDVCETYYRSQHYAPKERKKQEGHQLKYQGNGRSRSSTKTSSSRSSKHSKEG